jgi:hypothetical protein
MRLASAVLFTAAMLTLSPAFLYAQDDKKQQTEENGDSSNDLMSMLEEDENAAPKKEYTTSTFKSTRIINGHSIENVAHGVLDFRVSHRFGPINSGLKDFFGLDGANTSIGFDYGITDWLMVGISRSGFQKEIAGFTKIKLLRQTENNSMPLSVSYVGAMSAQTMAPPPIAPVVVAPGDTVHPEYYFSNRLYYVNQLLIARKFNNWLSLQLMPTHIHYNLVPTTAEPNNLYAIGLGGRLKLSNRISLTGEYYYRLNELIGYHNSVSVGLDIETGGHVFQLMLTNAIAMTERSFIGQSADDWTDGGIHFGFNISRVFTIVRPKGFEGSRNKVW